MADFDLLSQLIHTSKWMAAAFGIYCGHSLANDCSFSSCLCTFHWFGVTMMQQCTLYKIMNHTASVHSQRFSMPTAETDDNV